MTAASLYPIALDLRDKRCVVVGGGALGERKSLALGAAGAAVTVVAPAITPALSEAASAGAITHIAAPFVPVHLDNAFLVVAATDRPDVNTVVAVAARARGVLLNLAAPGERDRDNDEESGDFVTMAAVRRGDLLVAVTTGGAGPALSARLKRDLDAQFGPEWAGYVALLGEMRRAANNLPGAARTSALRRLAHSDSIRTKIAAGDVAGAQREALACLS